MDNFIKNEDFVTLTISSSFTNRLYEYTSKIEHYEKNQQTIFRRKIKVFHTGGVGGKHRFQLLTLNFYEEGGQSESTSFLRKISYLFDNLIVSVDDNMRIEKVNNIHELISRWQYIKEDIRKTYKGFAVENYFNNIDNLLERPERLIAFFQEYKMFGLFFNGLMNRFPLNKSIILEKSGTKVLVKKINNDTESIQLTTFLDNEKETLEGEFNFEKSCLLDATVKLSREHEKHKYKLLCFGQRKNLQ